MSARRLWLLLLLSILATAESSTEKPVPVAASTILKYQALVRESETIQQAIRAINAEMRLVQIEACDAAKIPMDECVIDWQAKVVTRAASTQKTR